MRGKDFLDKMELVDSTYIEYAEAAGKKKNALWRRWGTAAACVSAAAIIGVLLFRLSDMPVINPPDLPETDSVIETENHTPETTPVTEVPGNTTIGGISRDYKDISVLGQEIAIEWSWKYKTDAEKYTTMTVNGTNFVSSGRFTDISLLDGTIGTYDTVGYDYQKDKEYRLSAEVYRIRGVSENAMVAVKLGDDYVIFKDRTYVPPATFGELLEEYSLAENLPFNRFTVYSEHTDTGYFSLEDDWYIWEILKECRNASFIEDDNFDVRDGEYISFTATSDALGVYKKVFYVTNDGYIKTNIFDYGYTFDIGKEAAEKILTHAKQNSISAEREPYTNSLAGTLVEIAEDYILADDTFLCTDENDGMTFKIPTNDLRIQRCIVSQNIDIGDVVVVKFTGNIDVEAGNVVKGAYSLSEGTVSDGEVLIPE